MGVSRFCSLTHQLKRTLRLSQPAHGMKDSAGPKSLLSDVKPLAPPTEKIFIGDPNIVVVDLTMVATCVPHGWYNSNNLVTLRVGGNDDGTKFVVLFCVRFGDGKHCRECSAIRSRRKPFVSANDPLVSI